MHAPGYGMNYFRTQNRPACCKRWPDSQGGTLLLAPSRLFWTSRQLAMTGQLQGSPREPLNEKPSTLATLGLELLGLISGTPQTLELGKRRKDH